MHHRPWFQLLEKGGKHHEVLCLHNFETYLREYIDVAGIEDGPLFQTLRGRSDQLNDKRQTTAPHRVPGDDQASMKTGRIRERGTIVQSHLSRDRHHLTRIGYVG